MGGGAIVASGSWRWFNGSGRKRNPELFNHLKPRTPDQLRHHKGIKPRRIVLNRNGVGTTVERQPPDSVYLARVGEGQADRFCGRRGVTENNVDCRHRHRIPVWQRSPPVSPVTSRRFDAADALGLLGHGDGGKRAPEPHRFYRRRRHNHHRSALLDGFVEHVHRA
jgi:hypothetical protein